MSDNLLSLQNKLLSSKLPVLDSTLDRFNLLKDKATTTNQHLAEIIRADLGYTLAMFRAVNDSLTAGRDPVQSIEHAISMMGVAKATEIGQQLTVISTLPETARSALSDLYSQAHHSAQFFEAMSVQQKLPRQPDNTKTVKLMDLAQVVLWTNQPELMQNRVPPAEASQADQFTITPDNDMRELGQALANSWSLPESLQQALSPDFKDNKVAYSMALAQALAEQSALDWHSQRLQQLTECWAEMTEAPVARISGTIRQLAAQTARQLHGREFPLPAFFMLFPATKKSEKPAPESAQPIKTAESQSKPTEKTETGAGTAAPAKTSSLQQTLTRQMKNMQQQSGVDRVLFAILTPDRKSLKVRFVLGGSKQDAIRRFHSDLSQKTLFSLLMQKPQGIHLNKQNQEKYLPLIPASKRDSLVTDNLFAMSLFVHNKAIGMFIADSQGKALNALQYKRFKQFCQNAAKALENP